jgi:thiol:disulfide interchange protein DsbD
MLVRLVLLLLLGFASSVQAAESTAVTSPRATATLISDSDKVTVGKPFRIGLRLRIAPGWHTYWKNPGDAGVAPELTLKLPAGASAGPVLWPAPERQPEGPLMTWGYSGEVLLPVVVTPGADGIEVQADATWLVCNNICVPEEGSFRLTLPRGDAAPSAQAALFRAAEAAIPRASPWPAHVSPDGVLAVEAPDAVTSAWFAPDAPDAIQPAAAQRFSRTETGFALALTPGAAFPKDGPLAGVLVVQDRVGQTQALAVEAIAGPSATPLEIVPLWQTLLAALLGGMILNLMPCVFPVLALKAAALAGMSAEGRRHAARHAAAYTLGVVLSFMAIAGTLLAVRAASGAVGWGFQFQSPLFVAAMAWLLFVMGLNLSGVFLVHGTFTSAGQTLTEKEGLAGQFFTGVLAVLVATPCTAPFMGAAVAAALAASRPVTFLIFAVMGLGMAAPFLLLAVTPGLCRVIPRPGKWMSHFKQAMAFPMYGAAVWMIWVLSLQSGSDGVLAAGVGLVLLALAAWALGVRQHGGPKWFLAPAVAGALGALALLPGLAAVPPAAQAAEAGQEPYSPARLAALRAEGRPVFVNMTAAWCVTCLVNERVALSPENVRRAFGQLHVAYLKGDWTRQDPGITAFLRAHGRDGVPLYAVYLPGKSEPEVLPQILTPSVVLRALGAG